MKYYLHYVGSKLYPKEIFIKEAEQFGINRCIPMNMMKKLKWGDRILLASFIPKELPEFVESSATYGDCPVGVEPIEKAEKRDGRANKTGGIAEVFGYFDIRGLNLTASDELKKELTSQLNVVSSSEPNTAVQRQCGSYILSNSYIVTDSVKDIIEKAEKITEITSEKIKFFISGNFFPMEAIIENCSFTRAIIEVELSEELLYQKMEVVSPILGVIKNYNKRAYIKKYEKRGRPKKL